MYFFPAGAHHGGRCELKGMGASRPSLPLQLFDMGLEIFVPRLEALAKFAFGMGLPQVCNASL
jgi:hypothetical protein